MLRVNGFYGHVRRNDLRSLGMFAGFAVAFQIVAAVALFVPLLLLDTGHLPFVSLGYVGRYVPIVVVVGVALFLQRFLRHVASVRATVEFDYVERRTNPRLVNIVETTAVAAGLPAPKVGLIETSARNAFACGLSVSSAVIVVTRGLEEALDDDELAAVIAHEMAHIKNGDIRLMAAANVLMDILLLVQRKNLLARVGWKRALAVLVMPALLLLFGAAGLFTRVAFTIARASRLLIASSREFVADAEAVRLTHNPGALISALRRIDGRSAVAGLGAHADAMMIDGAVEGPFATHPTIAERITVVMRLAGPMVEVQPQRRDTRAAIPSDPAGGPWGTAAIQPAAAAPARFMVQRVNAGVKKNLFGFTPGARRVLMIGFGLMIGGVLAVMNSNKTLSRVDASSRNATSQSALQVDGGSRAGRHAEPVAETGSNLRRETRRLSGLDPLDARCFPTERYSVGDRGLRRLGDPDPHRVEAYARGTEAGSDEIVLERYLGLKERSLRAVAGAERADRDATLLAYVGTRKSMLWVAHRFFDDAGLRLMQQAYDSPADRAVVATLRDRLQDELAALRADGKLAREMELLIAAPQDFVPCLARAEAADRTAKATRTAAP